MDADCVGEDGRVATSIGHNCVEVFDRAFAVAAGFERVCHQSHAVLADVEGVFAVMWVVWVAVGDYHLCHAQAVEDRSTPLLVHVVDRDIGNDNAFTVVEPDVHVESSPGELVPVHGERDSLGLGDVYRL